MAARLGLLHRQQVSLPEALRDSLVQLRIIHIDSDEVRVHSANHSQYIHCMQCTALSLLLLVLFSLLMVDQFASLAITLSSDVVTLAATLACSAVVVRTVGASSA